MRNSVFGAVTRLCLWLSALSNKKIEQAKYRFQNYILKKKRPDLIKNIIFFLNFTWYFDVLVHQIPKSKFVLVFLPRKWYYNLRSSVPDLAILKSSEYMWLGDNENSSTQKLMPFLHCPVQGWGLWIIREKFVYATFPPIGLGTAWSCGFSAGRLLACRPSRTFLSSQTPERRSANGIKRIKGQMVIKHQMWGYLGF